MTPPSRPDVGLPGAGLSPRAGRPLEGRSALVVGASRGIGAAIVSALAAQGAKVTACARSEGPLNSLCDEVGGFGGIADPVVADATAPGSAEAVVEAARALHGEVDILVYAAGVHAAARFEEMPESTWRDLFELNLFGAVRFVREVVPGQRRRGWGRIVNIASTAALRGTRFQTSYNASKHALLGFTRSLALECAPDGVTVNAICPGFVDTPMTDAAQSVMAPLLGVEPEAVSAKLLKWVPAGRLIEPDEVAELACYLAGPAAAGLTGQGLTLDGGLIS